MKILDDIGPQEDANTALPDDGSLAVIHGQPSNISGSNAAPLPANDEDLIEMLESIRLQIAASRGSIKLSPYWEPSYEQRGYSFTDWLFDVGAWSSITDREEHQIGFSVSQRIGGGAKELSRRIDTQILRKGQINTHGDRVRTGLQVLLEHLERIYGPTASGDGESVVLNLAATAKVQFATFRRLPDEGIDDAVVRYLSLKSRAETLGSFTVSAHSMLWQILTVFEVPQTEWPYLLESTAGRLPMNNVELSEFLEFWKRQDRVTECTQQIHREINEGRRNPGATGSLWIARALASLQERLPPSATHCPVSYSSASETPSNDEETDYDSDEDSENDSDTDWEFDLEGSTPAEVFRYIGEVS